MVQFCRRFAGAVNRVSEPLGDALVWSVVLGLIACWYLSPDSLEAIAKRIAGYVILGFLRETGML